MNDHDHLTPDPDEIPRVPKKLVEWLERAYPDRVPDPRDDERELWVSVGKVQVVRSLRALLNQQEEEAEEAHGILPRVIQEGA